MHAKACLGIIISHMHACTCARRYVDTAQLSLVRRGYCHERFGNYRYDGDRVNHVGLRDQFAELEEKAESCTNPYSEDLAFGTLMDTDLYAD